MHTFGQHFPNRIVGFHIDDQMDALYVTAVVQSVRE